MRIKFLMFLLSLCFVFGCAARDRAYARQGVILSYVKGGLKIYGAEKTFKAADVQAILERGKFQTLPLSLRCEPLDVFDLDLGLAALRLRDKGSLVIEEAMATYEGGHFIARIKLDLGRLILRGANHDTLVTVHTGKFVIKAVMFDGVIDRKIDGMTILVRSGTADLDFRDGNIRNYMRLESGEKFFSDRAFTPGKKYAPTAADLISMEEPLMIRSADPSAVMQLDADKNYRAAAAAYNRGDSKSALKYLRPVLLHPVRPLGYDKSQGVWYTAGRILEAAGSDEAERWYLEAVFQDEEPWTSEAALALEGIYKKSGRPLMARAAKDWLKRNQPQSSAAAAATDK